MDLSAERTRRVEAEARAASAARETADLRMRAQGDSARAGKAASQVETLTRRLAAALHERDQSDAALGDAQIALVARARDQLQEQQRATLLSRELEAARTEADTVRSIVSQQASLLAEREDLAWTDRLLASFPRFTTLSPALQSVLLNESAAERPDGRAPQRPPLPWETQPADRAASVSRPIAPGPDQGDRPFEIPVVPLPPRREIGQAPGTVRRDSADGRRPFVLPNALRPLMF